ncbi:ABC transporter substrate-binding protein [Streptomyces omiyaensis]|uniref:helical backbone metal receptor n=1 Tax=Streptomyces omiyaensis TaxID=68247 RepID=UPI001679771D|nr:helical backbone metal receptor [Streptomyces omiyaensis]GGY48796.1 ABC transporter substrate-binding protein [Streptomyces omiyaensis]
MTRLRGRAPRVVSLVPSLTEAVAVTAPGLLVGATDWCVHPAGLDAARIGGTKNPDVPAVLALRPDLVLANEEENRPADLEALRDGGAQVLVTTVRTLDQGLTVLGEVLAACGAPRRPRWLAEAEEAWAAVEPVAGGAAAVVPIWRRPWMVLGRDTFAGDLLARLGVRNLYADHPERYPRVPLAELTGAGPELVVLPDEPYRFTPDDGPEAFPGAAAALVDGRMLTWYGPSLARAPRLLARDLRAALR